MQCMKKVWLSLQTHREAWRAVIHGVAKSRAQLSDWTELSTKHKQSPRTVPTNQEVWFIENYHMSYPWIVNWEKFQNHKAYILEIWKRPSDLSQHTFPGSSSLDHGLGQSFIQTLTDGNPSPQLSIPCQTLKMSSFLWAKGYLSEASSFDP